MNLSFNQSRTRFPVDDLIKFGDPLDSDIKFPIDHLQECKLPTCSANNNSIGFMDITAQVVDEDGMGLPGAHVIFDNQFGEEEATIAGAKGVFTITTMASANVTITHVGKEDVTIPASMIDRQVVLMDSVTELEDVEIIGEEKQRKFPWLWVILGAGILYQVTKGKTVKAAI